MLHANMYIITIKNDRKIDGTVKCDLYTLKKNISMV